MASISGERRNVISEASMYEMNASRIFNHQQKGKRRKKVAIMHENQLDDIKYLSKTVSHRIRLKGGFPFDLYFVLFYL